MRRAGTARWGTSLGVPAWLAVCLLVWTPALMAQEAGEAAEADKADEADVEVEAAAAAVVDAEAAAEVEAAVEETPSRAAADPADVGSIDAIMAAVYDVISGEAGAERDWDRFVSLFIPEGRLLPSFTDQQGEHQYRVWSAEEYADRA